MSVSIDLFWGILLWVIEMTEDQKLLDAVLKTAQMGRFGIETVMEQAVSPNLKQELRTQKSQYDAIENEAHRLAAHYGWKLRGLSPALRWMSAAMSRASVLGSAPDSRIAGMLVQGNAMGIIKGMRYLHRTEGCEAPIMELAQELVAREQDNLQNAQPFL